MVINYNDYKNDGWGLSKLGFEKLYELISNNPKENLRILEFGSGVSTKFFSDLSKILDKHIEVTSFDNSDEFMYKDTSNPDVVVNLRPLDETDDTGFKQMFVDKIFNSKLMKRKTSKHLMNMFYSLKSDDLSGVYDYMLLDGPHGNGRSLAFLLANTHLVGDSVIFIDDYTHYDFVDRFLSIYDADEIFRHIAGNTDKWKLGGDFIIFKLKKYVMENITVVDFKFAQSNDEYDEKYIQDGAWSRPYEYKYVIEFIKNSYISGEIEPPKIHNSSWGFEGIHVTFRDELDTLGTMCLHSDIRNSDFRETYYYDITTLNDTFKNKYDYVINVSTIEHLATANERIKSINNLFDQVKPNGYLILTFDYPRVNLNEIETLVGRKCESPMIPLNGENSINSNKNYKDLNIVYLILKKNG